MADQSAFSQVCPSCGRRVPRSVTTCRCGAALPEVFVADLPEADGADGSGTAKLAMVVVIGIAAVAGAAYWTFMPSAAPAPTPSRTNRPAASSAPNPESAPGTAAAASPTPGMSGQAQAWNAAAGLQQPGTQPAPAAAPSQTAASIAPPTQAAAGSIEEMVDQVMPAVVLIETSGGRGSGFFVARDTLITNVHVVQNDSYVTLRKMDGSTLNARVESRAPAFDIAVLKVAQPSASQAVIPMGSAHSLKPGQEIIVIGSALGTLQNSVSRGIVSGLRTAGGATLVQTDAATNPGNSGGPMLDRNGSVIGITTMGYRGGAEGLNFGVALDHARDILEGRQANVGTAGGGISGAIQAGARNSESARREQQGNEQFRAGLSQLATGAQNIDEGWQRFRKQCFQTRITGNYDREWFAVLVPHALPTDAAAGCVSYYNEVEGAIKEFKGLMVRLLNEARQAGVLPGTIRDALRQNKLEFEWDRY
jgi:S1-C subfamily serine protease